VSTIFTSLPNRASRRPGGVESKYASGARITAYGGILMSLPCMTPAGAHRASAMPLPPCRVPLQCRPFVSRNANALKRLKLESSSSPCRVGRR
jgi:hypothetical protein